MARVSAPIPHFMNNFFCIKHSVTDTMMALETMKSHTRTSLACSQHVRAFFGEERLLHKHSVSHNIFEEFT